MTSAVVTAGRPARSRRPASAASLTPASTLGLGIGMLWFSLLVLIPLAAIVVTASDHGWATYKDTLTDSRTYDALKLTVGVSMLVTALNMVMGTLIAWVLVRDEFPGKSIVNALIDLPFALPTIVASIVLLALYGPQSPIDIHLNATQPGLVVALLFVTLPFVVRSVQPVLIELDREVEEASASLGASNWTTFRLVIFPALAPAILGGSGLAFARAIGEYGSVVLIGGNIPRLTQMTSQYIQQQIEIDRQVNAAAVSVVLLVISFAVLVILRSISQRGLRRQAAS